MHRSSRRLLPPLLGLGGYLLAGAGAFSPGKASDSAFDLESKTPRQRRVTNLGSELQRLEEEWQYRDQVSAQAQGDDPLSKLSGAELRARIEDLAKQLGALGSDADWELREATGGKIRLALCKLAKLDGQAALEWVDEHFPDGRPIVMESWAAEEPAAALQAVIASKHKPPCSYETLVLLLQSRAEIGPSALREACDQVPWELYCYTEADEDPFEDRNGIQLPEETDLRPWMESGAAEAMASNGVAITNLFALWARQDPEQALARIEDWPDLDPSPDYRLTQILFAGQHGEEIRERIARALEALPPDKRERLAAEVSGSDLRGDIVELYPGFLPKGDASR